MKPLHVLFAVGVAVIWGTNFLITKVGLTELPPILFTCLRYTTVAVPLVFLVPRQNIPWSVIAKVGFFLGTLTFTLAFTGIKLGVPAGLTSLLLQSQVIFTLLLTWGLLRDRPTKEQWFGVALSSLGVTIMIGHFWHSATLVGIAFVLAGGLSNAFNNIVLRQSGKIDMFRLMIWMSIVPPLPLLVLSLLFEHGQWEALMHVTYRGAGAVAFNAFISTIIGFGLFGYLLKLYSPNQVTPFAFLTPVVGLIGGYLFLDETLDPVVIGASVLILVGLIYPHILYPIVSQTLGAGRKV